MNNQVLLQLVKTNDFKVLRHILRNANGDFCTLISGKEIVMRKKPQTKIDAEPCVALHYAAYTGNLFMLEILLDNGFNVDMILYYTTDKDKGCFETPLAAAVRGVVYGKVQDWRAVEMLLDRGADPTIKAYMSYEKDSRSTVEMKGTPAEIYLDYDSYGRKVKPPFEMIKQLTAEKQKEATAIQCLPLNELTKKIKAKPEFERSIKVAQKIETQIIDLINDDGYIESSRLRKMEEELDELNKVVDALDIAKEKQEIAEANDQK